MPGEAMETRWSGPTQRGLRAEERSAAEEPPRGDRATRAGNEASPEDNKPAMAHWSGMPAAPGEARGTRRKAGAKVCGPGAPRSTAGQKEAWRPRTADQRKTPARPGEA